MKKLFYISIGLLVLILIFLGIYNFAFKNNVNDPSVPETKEEKKTTADPEASEPSAPGRSSIISPINENLLGAAGAAEENFIYYYSLDDQALKKATFEGKNKAVLLSNLPGTPERIVWSPQRDRALLLLRQSDGRMLWHFADLAIKTLVPLKPELSRLAWSNLGDKIFYQYTDSASGERTLNIADPNGANWKKLALLKSDSFIAPIPRSTLVSFWNKPSALEKTFLEKITLSGESRQVLLTDKYGADYLWSPNGEKVLVSLAEAKGGARILLNIMNGSGGEFRNLSVPTLVSKAVWSKDNQTLYFAMPGSLPENAVLPDDYLGKSFSTKDTFWKIDTATGKKSRLVDLQDIPQSFDSTDLFLSPNEDALFFTERATRRLYRIDL